MKVTLTATLEGKITMPTSAEVKTFADLRRLASKLDANVRGVKKTLPDLASKAVENVKVSVE